jgi:D-aminopeptidase
VLLQANHGQRHLFRVNGVPVGQLLTAEDVPLPMLTAPEGTGSIIVVIATDAPLLPDQCRRLAQRATIGVARIGGLGEDSSGDIFLAFATGNRNLPNEGESLAPVDIQILPHRAMTPLFEAVAEATEEAILNAICMATTMTGIDGHTAYSLPLGRLQTLLNIDRSQP